MKYILLTLALLVSISASALKIELREIDFSRCPEIRKQMTEIMKTVDSDRRRVEKKLNLKGPNYYFVNIDGIDINDLFFRITWYDTDFYMDHGVKYNGYTVVGNDTLLIKIGDLADSIINRIGFYRKKTQIPFVNFPPRRIAKKTESKKIIWERSNDEMKGYIFKMEDEVITDGSYYKRIHNVTP